MSVNHNLLAITSAELASLVQTPAAIRDLVEQRVEDVQRLNTDGLAIVALTATSDDDPLAFMYAGASPAESGRVGRYAEENGSVIECEVDMGYGPASYYRNSFLLVVAQKLKPLTEEVFARLCRLDLLEENNVYPGNWHGEGRKRSLVRSFNSYRDCILSAARSGHHLLVWCD